MNKLILDPLYLSLNLAFISSSILIFLCMPLAWWLSKTKNTLLKKLIEAIIALPLVLPPTILGFYILIILNQNTIIGKFWFNLFGSDIIFSMSGLIIGSIIYSLPFATQPLQLSFEKIPKNIIEQAQILQKSNLFIILKIILPLLKNGIIKSFVLSFAHTLGEFGVVLMIGGNIPGKTQVLSIAIYEKIEQLDYYSTHILSLLTLLISFLVLLILFNINDEHET
ncbi:MAG TPA: molybdate ABC transporter permease subunit [Candidatus Azoamicus sp.]